MATLLIPFNWASTGWFKAVPYHSFLIRRLYICESECLRLGEDFFCPNLVSLTLTQNKNATEEALTLIQLCQLTLTCMAIELSATQELLDTLLGCPRLEELALLNVNVVHPED